MLYLLGIDDTDAPDAPQTADLALNLGKQLEIRGLAKIVHLSCHYLLNTRPSGENAQSTTACCLLLEADGHRQRELDLVCREVLMHESAPGSNAGYVLACWSQFDHEIVLWGRNAKTNRLHRHEALQITRRCGLGAAGILGSGVGVIGALAAVGLRFEGNDGWINWMPGLQDLTGVFTPVQLAQFIRFDKIETTRHTRPALDDRIFIKQPLKPMLKAGKIILPVTAVRKNEDFHWVT